MASTKEALASLYLQQDDEIKERNRKVVRTSAVGIVTNVLLAAFKAVIGIVSGSVAITMDAVNNLSDAGSSIITIIGTKLAAKPADKKHPFGYGRIEYLTAMVISIIVLYAGITSLSESIKKIISPETPDYSAVSLIIVAAAVIAKIVLGKYVKKKGKETGSDSLVNSGEDAMLDSVISASTLAAAAVYLLFGLSLESWLAAVISVIIIKSGLEMLRDTLSQILGEAGDKELAVSIKRTVMAYPEVNGVYDLVLNNYGPDAFNGSLHIEVYDTLSMDDLDELIRNITRDVYLKHKVVLTAVGIYSINTKDAAAVKARTEIQKTVLGMPYVTQMHGFHIDEEKKEIRFDLVISFDAQDRSTVFGEALAAVKKLYPDYNFEAVMDTDFTEN